MSDADDIEFLDEDADIVQQCVQFVQPIIKIEPEEEEEEEEEPPAHVIQKPYPQISPLLIERPPPSTGRPATAKKRKKEEDDTDYDPTVDSPYWNRRRRHNPSKVLNVRKYETASRGSHQSQSSLVFNDSKDKQFVRKPALPRTQINRRDMTIRIPDFDDPLCLPVRALVKDENDLRRLKHWNQLCLEQFKNHDTFLRPRNGPVSSSKRTVVIRNLFNKYSGKTETTFWSKISVEGKAGDTKSDVVQSVLPRYREKKILTAYQLGEAKRRRTFHDRCEMILSKENNGDEETLVAYNPEKSLSIIFKMLDSVSADVPEEDKRYLQELASCTACAPCYQAAWRGTHDHHSGEGGISKCPVCMRAFRAAPDLLAHLKLHEPDDIIPHRRAISNVLAKLLPYQYRCRVCQLEFSAVGDLRRHLHTHKGVGEFYCEVGNHTVS